MPLIMREPKVRRTLRLGTAATLTTAFFVASRSPVATAFLPASSSLVSTTSHHGGTTKKYKLNMLLNLLPSTTTRVGKHERDSTTTRCRPISTLLMALSSMVPATSALSAAAVDSGMASTTWGMDAIGDTVNNHAPDAGAGTMVLADATELLAAAGLDPNIKLGLAAFAGVGVAAAAFKTAVYWRMQYVVAALLTNRVPAVSGGAEVLELSAKDTKTLYYMPAGAVRRVILSTVKELDQQIVDGAAIQAKVPTALVREQKGGVVACPSGTMDCVVSIYGFAGGVAAATDGGGARPTLKGLAQEVVRVLKPGGTLLFVEQGEATELVELLRDALGTVEVNMVQNLVDPYCVALATKTTADEERQATGSAGEGVGETIEGGQNRRDRRRKKKEVQSRGR